MQPSLELSYDLLGSSPVRSVSLLAAGAKEGTGE